MDSPATQPERLDWRPMVLAAAAWAVPGAAHFALGKRARALAFLALVASAATIGLLLEGNLFRPLPGQPLTFLATLGNLGMGLAYLVLRWGVGYAGVSEAAGYEYGTAFLLSAGLMNLLLVLDAWDLARGTKD